MSLKEKFEELRPKRSKWVKRIFGEDKHHADLMAAFVVLFEGLDTLLENEADKKKAHTENQKVLKPVCPPNRETKQGVPPSVIEREDSWGNPEDMDTGRIPPKKTIVDL